jgi:hypothetical protein
MRAVAGIVVVLGMMLTACNAMPETEPAQQEEATTSESHERTQEFAASPGDCRASIFCGSWTTCEGNNGQCSVSSEGFGSVTCNNVTTICRPVISTCGCTLDGCCSEACLRDPDCGPNMCVPGKSCTSTSQCGGSSGGMCNTVTRTCSCYR